MLIIHQLCINTIRTLAPDIVSKANSGHPGTPMGCAPLAHALFSKFITINPKNPSWINRDRFVLSNGHACVLQYILLHVLGFDLTMDDLKQFRQVDSKTPGHPECHLTPGIETTTGPLGQGFANSVGLAIAQTHFAATFNKESFDLFTNHTFVIAGDGCLQEGISSEAASLAGHLKLGNLIVFYDDNHVSIDAFTEDVVKRFEGYCWHTQFIEDGDNDFAGICKAIENAINVKDKPSLIKIRTTIGIGSKDQGTGKVHVGRRGVDADENWNKLFKSYCSKYPELGNEIKRRFSGKLPEGWADNLPRYKPSDPDLATRKLSEKVLDKIADVLPELIGGSADLTESNLTRWKTAVDFQPDDSGLGNYAGRYIRYGVHEHAMSGAMNGLTAYGGIIPFGGTFLNFISYGLGSVRLSALSSFRVLYIVTHDSIGLGDLRALPNILIIRPADGNEVSGAYLAAIQRSNCPSVLVLSRHSIPQLEDTSVEKVLKGGYVLKECDNAQITLVATGSEVSLIVDTAKLLEKDQINTRIVSLPSFELFEEQTKEYQWSVLPDGIPILSVEALSTFGWTKYAHVNFGMKSFGSSGPYKEVFKKYGFVPEKIATMAKQTIDFYKNNHIPSVIDKPLI
nr:3366_t:CDS:10 [Entrophospora candida]